MQLLNYNMYGNFTCAEVPIFNKPNWLVYLMMYAQVVDRPSISNKLEFPLGEVQLWHAR